MSARLDGHLSHHNPRGLDLLTPLADQVDIRGLNRADAPMLAAHLLRLPEGDRNARFHAGMKDCAISDYVERIDWHDTYAFGAVLGGEMRAVAQLVIDRDGEAEVAVSVEPQVQHLGLGRLLVLAAMLAARRMGLDAIKLSYQRSNTGMRALARDLGAALTPDGPQVEAVISLRRADPPPAESGPAESGPADH